MLRLFNSIVAHLRPQEIRTDEALIYDDNPQPSPSVPVVSDPTENQLDRPAGELDQAAGSGDLPIETSRRKPAPRSKRPPRLAGVAIPPPTN
jgi:hypothetical protein